MDKNVFVWMFFQKRNLEKHTTYITIRSDGMSGVISENVA